MSGFTARRAFQLQVLFNAVCLIYKKHFVNESTYKTAELCIALVIKEHSIRPDSNITEDVEKNQ